MIRRIQQGVGRLMRTERDPWGIAVVIDGRFNAQWGIISSVLPKYMTDPRITKFVTRAELYYSVQKAMHRLEQLTGHENEAKRTL